MNNLLGDEIAGRIEALNWFVLDLAVELENQGRLDGQQFLQRIRQQPPLTDQLEYVCVADKCLRKLADGFDALRQAAAQKSAGA